MTEADGEHGTFRLDRVFAHIFSAVAGRDDGYFGYDLACGICGGNFACELKAS